MKYLESTYRGKKVFITGHTGFKGSWLLKILSDYGAIVKGYALVPENSINLYSAINGDSLCDSIIGDLRDKQSLEKAILDFKPDFIFHFAAQPLVRKSYEIPSETFEINVIGTSNLLNSLRFLENKCNTILITTDKVYHNNEWQYPYRENDRLGGYDAYSASKACCELVIDSFRNSFFNTQNYLKHQKAIAVGRAGNVIGGGDWSTDRLIPDIVRALSANTEIRIRNPHSIRPWQHVIEPLYGYLELGSKLNLEPIMYSKAFNFGPHTTDSLSVEDMVIKAINCWGVGKYQLDSNSDNPHEAGLLKLDISLALNNLGWKPVFNAQTAIERTINWYKNYYDNIPASELMERDITFYKNKINEQ